MPSETPEVSTEGNAKGGAEAATDLTASAAALIAKHGSEAVNVLLKDNHKIRAANRDLKSRLPAEGTVAVAAEKAALLAQYEALGLNADQVKQALAERDAARAEAEGFRRDKVHGEAATLTGFKAPVLSKLATQDRLDLVVIDGKDKAGRPVKIAAVKGEGDKTTPLKEYAETHWKDFLPALRAEAQTPPGGTPLHRSVSAPRPQIAPEGRQAPRRNSF